jgi:hypothetical protein
VRCARSSGATSLRKSRLERSETTQRSGRKVDREGVVRRLVVDHFDSAIPGTVFTFSDFNRPNSNLPVPKGQALLFPRLS